MTTSLGLEQQQKQQRSGNASAVDRSVSETRYSGDATITGDICGKGEGRLLLAVACDTREDSGASPAEATPGGDGHGTNNGAAPAPAVDDIQEEAEEEAEAEEQAEAEAEAEEEEEEGEGDDGEPGLWSALTFAWVSALPARLAGWFHSSRWLVPFKSLDFFRVTYFPSLASHLQFLPLPFLPAFPLPAFRNAQ
ncbi:unnamed protein product [Closterium sp. Yama58-4]|nr:unnamed protein product [Closterium sp. Yama58-4]